MADWGLLLEYYGSTMTMRREDLEMSCMLYHVRSCSCIRIQARRACGRWVSLGFPGYRGDA